jgi:hypothetical protein
MSKIVKIKQSDIENIVENIISEDVDMENSIAKEEVTEPKRNIALVKDEEGGYHVMDTDTGDILASK